MELRINNNFFIGLSDYLAMAQIKLELVDWQKEADTVQGRFQILGEYFVNESDVTASFHQYIPFTIIFKDANFKVNEVYDLDFTYYEVVGRGIETYFDIVILYDEAVSVEPPLETVLDNDVVTEVPNAPDSITTNIVDDERAAEIEDLKAKITDSIDQLLETKLEIKTDNLPTPVTIFEKIPDTKRKIVIKKF